MGRSRRTTAPSTAQRLASRRRRRAHRLLTKGPALATRVKTVTMIGPKPASRLEAKCLITSASAKRKFGEITRQDTDGGLAACLFARAISEVPFVRRAQFLAKLGFEGGGCGGIQLGGRASLKPSGPNKKTEANPSHDALRKRSTRALMIAQAAAAADRCNDRPKRACARNTSCGGVGIGRAVSWALEYERFSAVQTRRVRRWPSASSSKLLERAP